MNKVTEVTQEELVPILEARQKAVELSATAEKALKEVRVAELEFKVNIQQLFLDKNLSPKCNIDLSTGKVTWPEDEEDTEAEAEETKAPARARKKKAPAK